MQTTSTNRYPSASSSITNTTRHEHDAFPPAFNKLLASLKAIDTEEWRIDGGLDNLIRTVKAEARSAKTNKPLAALPQAPIGSTGLQQQQQQQLLAEGSSHMFFLQQRQQLQQQQLFLQQQQQQQQLLLQQHRLLLQLQQQQAQVAHMGPFQGMPNEPQRGAGNNNGRLSQIEQMPMLQQQQEQQLKLRAQAEHERQLQLQQDVGNLNTPSAFEHHLPTSRPSSSPGLNQRIQSILSTSSTERPNSASQQPQSHALFSGEQKQLTNRVEEKAIPPFVGPSYLLPILIHCFAIACALSLFSPLRTFSVSRLAPTAVYNEQPTTPPSTITSASILRVISAATSPTRALGSPICIPSFGRKAFQPPFLHFKHTRRKSHDMQQRHVYVALRVHPKHTRRKNLMLFTAQKLNAFHEEAASTTNEQHKDSSSSTLAFPSLAFGLFPLRSS